MTCPTCLNECDFDFDFYEPEDGCCPKCGHLGYWEEEYTDNDYWFVWRWFN